MSTDPIVRYAAGAVLVLAFAAALLVIVHGYWGDPNYSIPPAMWGILNAGIGGALALLGVHQGEAAAVKAVSQGAQVARQAVANGTQEEHGKA